MTRAPDDLHAAAEEAVLGLCSFFVVALAWEDWHERGEPDAYDMDEIVESSLSADDRFTFSWRGRRIVWVDDGELRVAAGLKGLVWRAARGGVTEDFWDAVDASSSF
jgi:hypothetical protein